MTNAPVISVLRKLTQENCIFPGQSQQSQPQGKDLVSTTTKPQTCLSSSLKGKEISPIGKGTPRPHGEWAAISAVGKCRGYHERAETGSREGSGSRAYCCPCMAACHACTIMCPVTQTSQAASSIPGYHYYSWMALQQLLGPPGAAEDWGGACSL